MKQLTLLFCLFLAQVQAQTGISVSPPRVYFDSSPGSSGTQKITITNVSDKNSLDLAVSLGDWEYDFKGENMMYPANTLQHSCASWLSVKNEDTYFTLEPGQRKELDVTLTPPMAQDSLAAHTAILYVSQMNPVDDVDSKGTNIKVSVRSGIKVFHKAPEADSRKIEIEDLKFSQAAHAFTLKFQNQSKIWVDGKVITEILNTQTGKKTDVDTLVFYTLPGNPRQLTIPLGKTLEKGNYTASVLIDYGDASTMEMAELNFTYE
ncbi:fimbrial biogenesis chaperone [Flavobacterium macacae]|uniref:Molecular chaperone n=1 Tax=Flavobacterium macacae TaxID=2488993 RepID=A0A3P3WEN1_9FLAO|nr:molecular chaperone [Flavobacterium macacae]RRJ93582.1 molecular chaperone [Flavobacterium macacae]